MPSATSTPAGRTTTVYLRETERRLIEVAAQARGVGPSRYLRVAALERARQELGIEPRDQ